MWADSPLIGITNKSYLGRCCVVCCAHRWSAGYRLSDTLAFDPHELSPTPLSIEAIQHLLAVFEVVSHATRTVRLMDPNPIHWIAR